MKLNNRGWGLSVFLGFTVILLLCVIVAGVNAYKLGLTKESHENYFGPDLDVPVITPTPSITPTPTEIPSPTAESANYSIPVPTPTAVPSSLSSKLDISDIRQDVIQAAGIYKNMHRKSLIEGEEFIVTFKQLVKYGYMKSIEGCTGYVQVKMVDRSVQYAPYLHCSTYVTTGYIDGFDEK